jgi:hypothetical protein
MSVSVVLPERDPAPTVVVQAYPIASRAVAETLSLPETVAAIATGGYAGSGDGGQALYVRGTNANGGFTDALGEDWMLAAQPVNVKMFGATGDGSTDDTAAFASALEYCQSATNDENGVAELTIGNGWYVISEEIAITNKINIRGSGVNHTVLDSRTSDGYLFNVTEQADIGGFWMLHSAAGGLRHYGAHRSRVFDVTTGFGSLGGTSFNNAGAQMVEYDRCIATTNGDHPLVSTEKPDCGFRFTTVSGANVPNCSVLHACVAEGMRLYGLYADGSSFPGNCYVKAFGSVFEGNGAGSAGYDVYLKQTFEAEFHGGHTEGVSSLGNVVIEAGQSNHFFGGLISVLSILGESVGNTFSGNYLSSVSEAATVFNSAYENCVFASNGSYRFSAWSIVKNTSNLDNYALDAVRTNVSERRASAPRILTANGGFDKWASTALPYEYTAATATILRVTSPKVSGSYACEVTCVGTTSKQGLAFSYLGSSFLSANGWVSVAVKVRRPAGQAKGIKIICNIGYDIVATIPTAELVDDTYVLVTRSFQVGNNDFTITLVPSSTPADGEYCYFDELVICEGKEPPQYSSLIQAKAAFGTMAGPVGFNVWEWGTAAPSSGNYSVGDVTWNMTPTAGGTMGWVCTTAGSPGTWKTFGAIAA